MNPSYIKRRESKSPSKGNSSKSIFFDIQKHQKSSKLEEYATKKLSEFVFRTKGYDFDSELTKANESTIIILKFSDKFIVFNRSERKTTANAKTTIKQKICIPFEKKT